MPPIKPLCPGPVFRNSFAELRPWSIRDFDCGDHIVNLRYKVGTNQITPSAAAANSSFKLGIGGGGDGSIQSVSVSKSKADTPTDSRCLGNQCLALQNWSSCNFSFSSLSCRLSIPMKWCWALIKHNQTLMNFKSTVTHHALVRRRR
jgi:hypothetical protein